MIGEVAAQAGQLPGPAQPSLQVRRGWAASWGCRGSLVPPAPRPRELGHPRDGLCLLNLNAGCVRDTQCHAGGADNLGSLSMSPKTWLMSASHRSGPSGGGAPLYPADVRAQSHLPGPCAALLGWWGWGEPASSCKGTAPVTTVTSGGASRGSEPLWVLTRTGSLCTRACMGGWVCARAHTCTGWP